MNAAANIMKKPTLLTEHLQSDSGFIPREAVCGALLKADISNLPKSTFSTKGMNALTKSIDVFFENFSYVPPRPETPCLYGSCMIFGVRIATESHLAWVDFKHIQSNKGGIFTITIDIENETGISPRLLITLDVCNEKPENIKMSPVLGLLKARKSAL